MNLLLSYLLEKNRFNIAKFVWQANAFFNKNQDNVLWVDNKGNTLAHYAAKNHNLQIWEFAKTKPMDIKHLNKKGLAPIHCFVERAFIEKSSQLNIKIKMKNIFFYFCWYINEYLINSEKIESWLDEKKIIKETPSLDLAFNEQLFHEMIRIGSDVNQFMEFPEKKALGWSATDIGSFSRRNIIGTPLELLIHLFWDFVLYPVFDNDMTVVKKYERLYELLTSSGANINELARGEESSDKIKDAMQDPVVRIGSIFFCQFLASDVDLHALKPILADKNLDFKISGNSKNTVLHTLFARISSRHHVLSPVVCEELLKTIVLNESFTVDALDCENQFGVNPLQCLREDAKEYRKFFESYMLHERLQVKLSNQISKTNKKKIKI